MPSCKPLLPSVPPELDNKLSAEFALFLPSAVAAVNPSNFFGGPDVKETIPILH